MSKDPEWVKRNIRGGGRGRGRGRGNGHFYHWRIVPNSVGPGPIGPGPVGPVYGQEMC